MKLSEAKAAAGQFSVDNIISEAPKKKEVKSPVLTAGERLKASNFPATVLKIGTWEYISRYEGDLVAKCYFAKHKLVWEVLDDGLKSKIEIQWSDITALKATYPENEQGTLDLVLARPPLFFKETDPQPRKHTLWQAASDFTNGQASLNRRHTLQCPSTLLSKNFEKLIQCDQRLNELSQQADIILETPDFEPRCSIFENPNESKDCHGFNNLKYERETSLPKFTDPVSPCAFSSPSKKLVQPEFPAQPINIAFGPADFQASGFPQEPKNPNWRNQLKLPGLRSSMSMNDFVNHIGNCIAEQRTVGNPPVASNGEQSKEVLEDLVQYLFSDTQGPSASDDKYLMARVDSFYNLLENDGVPSAMTKPNGNDSSDIGIVELDSDGSDEEPKSAPARKTAGGTELPTISRKDSFGDLPLNLPRIASIQQFLFDITEDYDK
uniref:TRF2/HOY1 PH-like domain-containing protein n=1 Tax=Arundo donax TaxID=35708 RepID=A0A0A9CL08_ARUDO